jgi:hypothetical protein
MLIPAIMSFVQILARRGTQSTRKAMLVWPDKAVPVSITSGSTSWTYATWTQVIAANAITTDYMVMAITVSGFDTSNALDYQLELGTGNSPNEVSVRPIALHHEAQVGEGIVHIEFPIPMEVLANVRVAAQLACSSIASAKTLKISLHTAPLPL